MSDETSAPFTFKPAAQKPTRHDPTERTAGGTPRRARRAAEPVPEKKTRKRRARVSTDVAVLKACLRQLRTLDPKDALRTVETLRVLFK